MALFDATLDVVRDAPEGSLTFTNFVDFDSAFGHRRDVAGYAHALEEFDRRLPELDRLLRPGDLVLITADHGCDPTWPGSDHTREHVPRAVLWPRHSREGSGPALNIRRHGADHRPPSGFDAFGLRSDLPLGKRGK